MAIFGKNGFIRKQEVVFARKLLVWQYEKSGSVLPDEAALLAHAEKVVAEAHRIAKKSGSNVLEILKNQVKEFKK
jgi:hypothetical protein